MPRNEDEDEGATAMARGGRHGERRLTKREARGMSMGTTTYGYGEWVTVGSGRCLWHADFDRCCVAGSTTVSKSIESPRRFRQFAPSKGNLPPFEVKLPFWYAFWILPTWEFVDQYQGS